VTNFGLGFLQVFVQSGHVLVVAKVWNEVVLLDLFWVTWDPLMVSLFFSLGNAFDRLSDIVGSVTKVRNEIVLFEAWSGLAPVPFVSKFVFGS